MTTPIAIDFQNITLGFEGKLLLTQFNAALPVGSCVGIFGVNGAGKSTLIRALIGLIRPVLGQIQILGQPCQKGHAEIGYMPQLRSDVPTHLLTGRAYLEVVLCGLGWGLPFMTRQQRAHIQEIIDLTGMQDYIDRPYALLSGGEKQRLTFAQALLNKPKILLLDEPLSSLDPAQQTKTMELIQRIQKTLNITVLITAHDINPLLDAMDSVIYLAQGKAVFGTVDEVINSQTLSRLYDMPIEVIPWGNRLLVINQPSGIGLCNVHCQH